MNEGIEPKYIWMEISRRSLCSSVMVLRAIVIHTMEDVLDPSDTFLSFVAFEKSIEDAGGSPG